MATTKIRSLPSIPSTPTDQKGKKSKLSFLPGRYSILAENEANISDHEDTNQNECLHTINQVEKLPQLMYVKGATNFSQLRNAISNEIGPDSFICKLTTTHLKIQTNTRKLQNIKTLTKIRIPYISTPVWKSFSHVIKNIHPTTDPSEISSALEEIDFTVRQVTNIKQHYQTKLSLTLFFVDIAPETISKEIFNIISLLNTKIREEEPHKRRKIPQCQNCQTYGHTKATGNNWNNCFLFSASS